MTILNMPPIADKQSQPAPTPALTRRLYHVTVPANKYDLIKRIADLLAGESYSNEYLDAARTRCTRIALSAVVEVVVGSKKPKKAARGQQ